MISTVTTSTVSTVATVSVATTLTLVCLALLVALLIQKEIAASQPGQQSALLSRLLNIGLWPLLTAFAVTLVIKLMALL